MKQSVVKLFRGLLVIAGMLACVMFSAPQPAYAANGANDGTEHSCLKFSNHEYEVCTAYIANSSYAALVPYYKYVHSENPQLARFVTYRLGSRYSGSAYTDLRSRPAGWPIGTNEVSVPKIEVIAVSSSLKENRASLVTRETWRVYADEGGALLYSETGQHHTIQMERVPSYILHKWIVTSIR